MLAALVAHFRPAWRFLLDSDTVSILRVQPGLIADALAGHAVLLDQSLYARLRRPADPGVPPPPSALLTAFFSGPAPADSTPLFRAHFLVAMLATQPVPGGAPCHPDGSGRTAPARRKADCPFASPAAAADHGTLLFPADRDRPFVLLHAHRGLRHPVFRILFGKLSGWTAKRFSPWFRGSSSPACWWAAAAGTGGERRRCTGQWTGVALMLSACDGQPFRTGGSPALDRLDRWPGTGLTTTGSSHPPSAPRLRPTDLVTPLAVLVHLLCPSASPDPIHDGAANRYLRSAVTTSLGRTSGAARQWASQQDRTNRGIILLFNNMVNAGGADPGDASSPSSSSARGVGALA